MQSTKSYCIHGKYNYTTDLKLMADLKPEVGYRKKVLHDLKENWSLNIIIIIKKMLSGRCTS